MIRKRLPSDAIRGLRPVFRQDHARPNSWKENALALTILVALAGLIGAAGVILAAAGAHAAPNAGLDSAAYLLLFHAAAVLGGAALTQQGLLWRPLALVVLIAWIAGAALFSGDVALRAFAGHRLFPMAAPAGGVILIAAWLGLFAAAIGALIQRT
jgi:uncharacterized membrane protein YgdD (TMEM256/DUF423 family)